MESTRSPYIKHIFVCVNQRDPGVTCCARGGDPAAQAAGQVGGEAILERLKAYVKANGLKGKVRVSRSGCMDLCAQGPNVMVEPDHRWYSDVSLEDVERIIEEELAPLVIARTPSDSEGDEAISEIASVVPSGLPRNDGRGQTPTSIQAFLFDLGNVLVQFDHMRAAEKIAANAKVTPDELYRLFFESPLIVAHDEGRISTEAFFEKLKSQIQLSLSYEEFLSIWNGIFTENRQMTDVVRRLLVRYPCFLISNTNRPHFEYLLDRCPLLKELSGRVLSYEVGVLKPHPAIYRRALELVGLAPSQIFYVDDRQDLIEAAQGMGFQTHRFTEGKVLEEALKERGVWNGQ